MDDDSIRALERFCVAWNQWKQPGEVAYTLGRWPMTIDDVFNCNDNHPVTDTEC